MLGLIHISSDPADGRNDVPLGASYVLRACHLNTSACEAVLDAASVISCRGDEAAAVQLHRLACAEGYPLACAVMAHDLLEGVEAPRDVERAAALYSRVCDAVDRFPDYVPAGASHSVVFLDPMALQIRACVLSERLAQLGVAMTPPQTTPEAALILAKERAETYGERRRSLRDFSEKRLALERASAARTLTEILTWADDARKRRDDVWPYVCPDRVRHARRGIVFYRPR